ncbi:hypothetical protein [Limimaricola hongkongensis]|uniref:DUF1850 domain-containing protein n=1 Tax=Limimaricola hongkongensis DSM 17492 TaxID=1122180 RepID=A0A017HGN3_9RHOB|nr:hypothetical protein [Limimaricola hongkongensis]EYD73333.1 hypothetical protein Lokhon_00863 [Limimaricola hongkongensis DSM 17492]
MRLWPALLAALAAGPAQAVELHFCWRGGAGYTMTGTMAFPDALMDAPLVTQGDVTRFEITGWRHGARIGAWRLDALTPGTSWLLTFDPRERRFPMSGIGVFQAWNADGGVADCGNPGFGFNAGNGGQDVCVDGRFVTESTIPWQTPLHAGPEPVSPDCAAPLVVSAIRPA